MIIERRLFFSLLFYSQAEAEEGGIYNRYKVYEILSLFWLFLSCGWLVSFLPPCLNRPLFSFYYFDASVCYLVSWPWSGNEKAAAASRSGSAAGLSFNLYTATV